MSKKQKNKKLIIVLALILLVTISIGYATISTTLTINGTANIAATSWKIYFTNVQPTVGNGATVTTAPSVPENSTSTVALSYNVTLNQPGDYYEFTVDVVNGGTINAKIAADGITKTIKIGNNDLTEAQAKLIDYTVTYADDSAIAVGDTLAKAGTANNANTRTLKVRVAYKTDITPAELNAVEDDMTLTLTFGLNYDQN